jgi:hypothetical protein
MPLTTAIGQATGLDATEAAIQATDEALSTLGRAHIALGIISASSDYPVRQIVNGVSGLLRDTPLLGFSTPAQLSSQGISQRSIIVALLVSDEVATAADWWPGFAENSTLAAQSMLQSIPLNGSDASTLLLIAEGLNGDAAQLVSCLPAGGYSLAGCLACGDISSGRTFQIGGSHYGTDGLAAATLSGNIRVGIGTNHGWQPVGVYTHITSAKEHWLRSLDGRRASETYARIFGYPARDWAYPPLNQLVRLYPLGIDQEITDRHQQTAFNIRSPIRVEADGSLRMHTKLPQGKTAYILVSSVENCLASTKIAAQQALESMGEARPVLVLVFADIALKLMLQGQPGLEIDAIQAVMGANVPIIGGYTFGQIGRAPDGQPNLFNQHIQIVVFGDPA